MLVVETAETMILCVALCYCYSGGGPARCLVILGATPVSAPKWSLVGNLLFAVWSCMLVLSVDLARLGRGLLSSVSVSILWIR